MTESNRKQLIVPIMNIQRVIDFSDGIFTFTATLLIGLIVLPQLTMNPSSTELTAKLQSLWPYVIAYVLSFLNIANYWKIHYDVFSQITRADNTLITLNTLFLLSVTFLPLPTAIMAEYGQQPIGAAIYGAAVALSYGLFYLIARYAKFRKLVKQDLKLPLKRYFRFKLIAPFCLAFAGAALSFAFPQLSALFYFIIALLNIAPVRLLLRGYEFITPWDDNINIEEQQITPIST